MHSFNFLTSILALEIQAFFQFANLHSWFLMCLIKYNLLVYCLDSIVRSIGIQSRSVGIQSSLATSDFLLLAEFLVCVWLGLMIPWSLWLAGVEIDVWCLLMHFLDFDLKWHSWLRCPRWRQLKQWPDIRSICFIAWPDWQSCSLWTSSPADGSDKLGPLGPHLRILCQ